MEIFQGFVLASPESFAFFLLQGTPQDALSIALAPYGNNPVFNLITQSSSADATFSRAGLLVLAVSAHFARLQIRKFSADFPPNEDCIIPSDEKFHNSTTFYSHDLCGISYKKFNEYVVALHGVF